MPVIIQITTDIINIGMDDGSILPVTRNELNFLPSLGDEVRVFRSETQTIVTKVEKPQPEQAQQYQQYRQSQYQEPPQHQQYQQYQQPPVIINNTNTNTNVVQNTYRGRGRQKDKWVAFLLCLFLGMIGVHKFYEGKIGMGILYFFTGGLFCIGWIIDLIALLCKPNPYYV